MSESSTKSQFQVLEEDLWPALGEEVKNDLYVCLPNSDRYVCFVCKNDVWDEHKLQMLKSHTDPQLYCAIKDLIEDSVIDPNALSSSDEEVYNIKPVTTSEAPEEVLIFKQKVDEDLKTIFTFLKDPNANDSTQTLKSMEQVTEKILEAVAPEIDDLKGAILANSKYLMVMADAAAITSIAVLIAMSHGFDSRKIFRDLSTAIMLMDLPLRDMNEASVHKYYLDPTSLNAEELRIIKQHPQKAYEFTSKKLKALPEPVLQLMLNHHENYNGTGYPKGLRNEQLPSIVRSMCLAVNVFEVMKREDLKGNQISLLQALEELRELNVEAHRRKHNQRLVSQSIEYVRSPSVSE